MINILKSINIYSLTLAALAVFAWVTDDKTAAIPFAGMAGLSMLHTYEMNAKNKEINELKRRLESRDE